MTVIMRRGKRTHLPTTHCIFHLTSAPLSLLYNPAQLYLCRSGPCCRLSDVSISIKCLQGAALPFFGTKHLLGGLH